MSIDDSLRRIANQAFFDKLIVTDDDTIHGEPGVPFNVFLDRDVQTLAVRQQERTAESGTQTGDVVGLNNDLLVALSSLDTNKWLPLLARDWECQPTPVGEHMRSLRQRQKRLTEVEVARMVARYTEGATVYELAGEFGIERRTVAVRLKGAGVVMRRQPAGAEQLAEMVRLYGSGLSLAKVGDRTGFSSKTVLNYLRAEGVRVRDSHGRERA